MISLLNKASNEKVGRVPDFWAKGGYPPLYSDLLRFANYVLQAMKSGLLE
jgi:hypothetical protein